jgi:outer membrane protein OmpA-like peptidoglycan-associated protein
MKKLVFFGLIVMFVVNTVAQDDDNLVTNPSFESTGKGKLKKLKQITVAENWESPTGLNADLFDKTKPLPCSAPNNSYGKEFPMDGNRYAGIVAYSYNNKEPRTYIQTQLLGSLTKDVEYCVKYYVSLSDLSKYAVNNLGAYIGKDPLEEESKTDIIFEKEKEFNQVVLIPGNKILNARYNWEPVCGVYKASGKEKFLVIGNFHNNKDTKWEKLKKLKNFQGTQIPKAYYYIDQVEVFIIENLADCDCSNKMKAKTLESMVYHKDFMSEDGYTVEEQIKLTTVYFDMLSVKIERLMVKDLDNLGTIMLGSPEFKLELTGLTDQAELDAQRSDPENENIKGLGKKRAEKVKAYLVEKGIEGSRILINELDEGASNSKGATRLDRAKNRRVEVKLVK